MAQPEIKTMQKDIERLKKKLSSPVLTHEEPINAPHRWIKIKIVIPIVLAIVFLIIALLVWGWG